MSALLDSRLDPHRLAQCLAADLADKHKAGAYQATLAKHQADASAEAEQRVGAFEHAAALLTDEYTAVQTIAALLTIVQRRMDAVQPEFCDEFARALGLVENAQVCVDVCCTREE